MPTRWSAWAWAPRLDFGRALTEGLERNIEEEMDRHAHELVARGGRSCGLRSPADRY
ncbi:hypothetical protein SCE1572_36325 [Sorangium cellulosum So0157-2]|uniref:Uncharacterized protein n=1 Tax=Sorangium cellulosum So0157-2 TaxID=1254432 RepID=S4Y9L2_SORCE|nr:hypothetical protein SCE1572_36325 [Sorangium cellulosum So0157-2]